jgi:hypothetical protein
MVDVRKMLEADAEDVSSFLAEHMHRNLSSEYFRKLFVRPWVGQNGEYGFVLIAQNKIVGCLGTIYSSRTIAGRREDFLNLTAWCVMPKYRRFSLSLLDKLPDEEKHTITDVSPTRGVEQILRCMHYQVLDTVKLFLGPLTHFHTLFSFPKPRVISDTDVMAGFLSSADRKILKDHIGIGCQHLLLSTPSGYCYIVSKRVDRHAVRFTEVLYVSDPKMLLRHLELAKLHILYRDRSPFLAADERLIGRRLRLALAYRRTSMFRSKSLTRDQIDNLYTEKAIF